MPVAPLFFGLAADWLFEGDLLHRAHDDAVRVIVHDQVYAGVDIITDGEQGRTSYVTAVVKQLGGFDYERLTKKLTRRGRYNATYRF